jgi:hypothetical protein
MSEATALCGVCHVEPRAVRLVYVPGVGQGEKLLKRCNGCLAVARAKSAARRERTARRVARGDRSGR